MTSSSGGGQNRSNQLLDKYLQEIGHEELISAEQEIEYSRKMHENGPDSLKYHEKLVRANLRFVVSVAKQYQNQGLSLIDLINEGNMGLIKAAHRFDETKGFKFISYAVWWIKQAILQALAEQSRVVRLPLNKVGALNRISKMMTSLEKKFEREPTSEEIAEALETTELEVSDTLKISGRQLSIDAEFTSGEDNKLLDVLKEDKQPAPDQNLFDDSLREEIEIALESLSSREKEVVMLYFGIDQEKPLTLEEIGSRFGLTRERVRQIKEKAIRRLRHTSRSKALRAYLG